jgi:hypothetical protein
MQKKETDYMPPKVSQFGKFMWACPVLFMFGVRLGSLPLVIVAGSYGGCVHWTPPFLVDLVFHILLNNRFSELITILSLIYNKVKSVSWIFILFRFIHIYMNYLYYQTSMRKQLSYLTEARYLHSGARKCLQ